jgi:aspartyl/glutamyl-tRNA(Asn/Gln) amidotransferase C subunit
MSKIEKIKKIALHCDFNLSDDQIEKISNEFDYIVDLLDSIKKIDTSGISPTDFINKKSNAILNNDEFIKTDKKLFNNTKNFKGDFLEIKDEKQ